MTKVAILQSSYIPWKGYFDLINRVDKFVVYDVAQYTRRDWRNRNKIKTKTGTKWLTIPVKSKGKYAEQQILDAQTTDLSWQKKHWATLKQFYSKASYFEAMAAPFERFYKNNTNTSLSHINATLIGLINSALDIQTTIHYAQDFNLQEGKTERLVGICEDLKADCYLSGPAAQDYLDIALFEEHGIGVEWMDYSNYPEYRQAFPPFEHGVTILDLLFNEGPNAPNYMKSFR